MRIFTLSISREARDYLIDVKAGWTRIAFPIPRYILKWLIWGTPIVGPSRIGPAYYNDR